MTIALEKIIRDRRKELDLSQEQLASALGVSKNSVYNWERGIRPDFDALVKLENALGIVPEIFPQYKKSSAPPLQPLIKMEKSYLDVPDKSLLDKLAKVLIKIAKALASLGKEREDQVNEALIKIQFQLDRIDKDIADQNAKILENRQRIEQTIGRIKRSTGERIPFEELDDQAKEAFKKNLYRRNVGGNENDDFRQRAGE